MTNITLNSKKYVYIMIIIYYIVGIISGLLIAPLSHLSGKALVSAISGGIGGGLVEITRVLVSTFAIYIICDKKLTKSFIFNILMIFCTINTILGTIVYIATK